MAIVSIMSQQVTFYDTDGWILRAPVSTGTTRRETPVGVFAIIEKDKDHHSTLYDDAWMPNMQRITWNGIALHGGRGRRQGRARPHHHPAGCAPSHRADCIAAVLDHRLGRAAEPRDQLSHRVRRGASTTSPRAAS